MTINTYPIAKPFVGLGLIVLLFFVAESYVFPSSLSDFLSFGLVPNLYFSRLFYRVQFFLSEFPFRFYSNLI